MTMAEHLDAKKLHLNKLGKSILTNSILKYLRSTFWIGIDSSCSINKEEYKFEELNFPPLEFCDSDLKSIWRKNINRSVVTHLNINFFRSKFDLLPEKIKENVDMLVISERKLKNSFLSPQFQMAGYASSFWLDQYKFAIRIMFFCKGSHSVQICSAETKPIEDFCIGLNYRQKKKLLCCSNNPHKSIKLT